MTIDETMYTSSEDVLKEEEEEVKAARVRSMFAWGTGCCYCIVEYRRRGESVE